MPRSSTNPMKTRIAQRKLYTRSLRNVGLRWSRDDEEALLQLKKNTRHFTLKQMAEQLGRTTSGVSAALRKLRSTGELSDGKGEDNDEVGSSRHHHHHHPQLEPPEPMSQATPPPPVVPMGYETDNEPQPWTTGFCRDSHVEQSYLRNHLLLHMHCDDDGRWMSTTE
jgi:predicted transcriptional regulator